MTRDRFLKFMWWIIWLSLLDYMFINAFGLFKAWGIITFTEGSTSAVFHFLVFIMSVIAFTAHTMKGREERD